VDYCLDTLACDQWFSAKEVHPYRFTRTLTPGPLCELIKEDTAKLWIELHGWSCNRAEITVGAPHVAGVRGNDDELRLA
jgi:hypothetical protein